MFRVPDNRPNERTSKGEQPYQDDRERLAQNEAEEADEAPNLDEQDPDESEGNTRRRLETEAGERFARIANDERNQT
jgi:hypothetical protein